MSLVDRSLIAELPLFANMSPEALDDVLRDARSLHCPKGKAVFQQNEKAHSFFVLLHGRLRVTQVTADGQQIVVRFVGAGEVFGVAQAIGRSDYPGTATAVVDSVALAWASAAWPLLVGKYPTLATQALQTVGGRLQEAHARLREISTEQVERRVARAILRLTHQAGRKTAEGILIDFPVTRQDIAELTGTTLFTVSRILSLWEGKGWVEGGRQRILVRDPHQLFLLAEGDGE